MTFEGFAFTQNAIVDASSRVRRLSYILHTEGQNIHFISNMRTFLPGSHDFKSLFEDPDSFVRLKIALGLG